MNLTKKDFENIFHIPILGIQQTRLCSLWAGFGSIYSINLTTENRKNGNHAIHLIYKFIQPPATSTHDNDDIGTQRKLKSYLIEKEFYQKISPHLIQNLQLSLPQCFYCSYQPESSQNNLQIGILMNNLNDQYPISLSTLSFQQSFCVLTWLAKFHSSHFEQSSQWESYERNEMIWSEGCYWRLDTRYSEYQNISKKYKKLKLIASPIATILRDGVDPSFHPPHQYRTIIHGDYKAANILFQEMNSSSPSSLASPPQYSCVCYDFQYLGIGFGVRDLVKLFVSSMDLSSSFHSAGPSPRHQRHRSSNSLSEWKEMERNFLEYYREQFIQSVHENLAHGGIYSQELVSPVDNLYPFSVLQYHYEIALIDYMRFMAGWGLWGNTDYAEQRANEIIQELDGGKNFTTEQYREALMARYQRALSQA
jgi:hypothetical protein